MRITSYNIRKAVGLDWRRDAGRIIDVLAEIDADVVVLQEADKRLGAKAGVLPLNDLAKTLALAPVDVAIRPESHGWHGNAIFCKPGHMVTHAARIDIPTFEPRGAVSALLQRPAIEVIGVHLGLSPGMRRKQMRMLADHIRDKPHPVVIAGDFNEWKADSGIFGAAARVIAPGPSFHAARPRAALDRFVLSGAVQPLSSHVHASPLARRASDHLPIVLDIDVKEPAE
ncbi:endonuclease/exonuclease/phosphatase family protein [Thalassococcus sp. BH17M4-6]|uniref:endonuclease/exonuclease/phosphatase family protein n=1 Tax=Thalassococcus sp. BH17M4-6 TaxID=3413148 RepID=UPI003BD7CB5E